MKYLLVLLLILPTMLQAKEKEFVELQSRIVKSFTTYKVNDDFTVETTAEVEMKALTDELAKKLKKQSFSHSTSIESLEVLEAYTLKSTGKKILVPKDNYQVTVNKGKGKGAAIFSDRTSISIVFPELEKNDSIYFRTKRTEKEPMFPGQFSLSGFYFSQMAFDDVQVRFDLPEKLKYKHKARKMKEKSFTRSGRRIIELTYQNKKPVKIDRQDFSVWDESKEAGFAISTFPSYKAIARAYAARALPKSNPTERVKKLAVKILDGEKNKQRQARLLYDWVATNISYAGNCIGVGAVVPHDTDFILDNRMGDCKDHATLLEALYRSVGIKSVQALINASTVYQLPAIPLVTAVNHVINYLPEWDKYVDSTNSSMPFDLLSYSLMDKPVILVEGENSVRQTPSMKLDDTYQALTSTMKIQPDGSVKGNIEVVLKGNTAAEARRGWRNVTKEREKEWLERTFSSRNKVGFATMTKDDPEPLTSEFKFAIDFTRPDFIPPKGTGGFYVGPPMRTQKDVFSYLDFSNEEIEGYDVACGNGTSIEKLIYVFPIGMKILAKPDNFSIDENFIQYKSSYKLDGNKLVVTREVKDSSPANVCSAELINKQRSTLIKISDSLRSQVIYQH